jgi:predicted MFS family arabinose efflux permease
LPALGNRQCLPRDRLVGGLAGGFLIDALGFRQFYLVSALPVAVAMLLLIKNWRIVAGTSKPALAAA